MGKTLAERLASADPQGVNNFLMQHGFASARDGQTLVHNINHFIQQGDDDLLLQLMELHPDYEVFEEISVIRGHDAKHHIQQQHHHHHPVHQQQNHHHPQQQQHHHNADGFNNCSGCGGKCGMHHNATGGNGGMMHHWGGESFGKSAFYATLAAVSIIALVSLARNPREAK